MNRALLQARAELFSRVRTFFFERQVLEVGVPVSGCATVTDPFVETLHFDTKMGRYYLQSSPEYFMKRLLSAGSGSIYSMGPAFRNDEHGRHHHHEFTLLEWYRCGYDDRRLMAEIGELMQVLTPNTPLQTIPYRVLFERATGLNPHVASAQTLKDWIDESVALGRKASELLPDIDDELLHQCCCDLIFSYCIEPTLASGFVFVCDYPQSQCALARLDKNAEGHVVARRFELYFDGLELANGYWELTDPKQQRERFARETKLREKLSLPSVDHDQAFLAALDQGLPDCAGVALGLDRLLMKLNHQNEIRNIMPFFGS